MADDFSEVLRRARTGDREAFAELHRRYAASVRAVVSRRAGHAVRRRHDADDLVQSVFEDVLRDLASFDDRGEEAFRHWLFLKAENKVKDKFRRNLGKDGARREASIDTDAQAQVPVDAAGPATQAGDADERFRLREVLDALEPQQREVLVLRDERGLSWDEVARRLELPSADAARKRYARALLIVRERWKRD